MIVILFAPLLVIVPAALTVLVRRHGRLEPWRLLRVTGMALAVFFALFAGLFIAAETFDDPGGRTAVLLVAAWLVPMAVLGAVAWWRPQGAAVVLAALVLAVVAIGVWYAVDPDAWRSFEDDRGPVRAIGVFALSLPLALLAWRRPVLGGGLLVVLAVLPGALALLSSGAGGVGGSSVAATAPAALIGACYLTAGMLRHHTPGGLNAGRRARPASG